LHSLQDCYLRYRLKAVPGVAEVAPLDGFVRQYQVQMVVMNAIGGENVTTTIESRARYPVNVRYMRDSRSDLGALGRVRLPVRGQEGRARGRALAAVWLLHVPGYSLSVAVWIGLNVLWETPMKHLTRFDGCGGLLIATADRLNCRVGRRGESRTWRFQDIDNVSVSGPFHLRVTTLECARSHHGSREDFNFQLKAPLSGDRCNDLWRRLHPPALPGLAAGGAVDRPCPLCCNGP